VSFHSDNWIISDIYTKMLIRLKDFVFEQEDPSDSPSVGRSGKLSIKWLKPDLAEEVESYDDAVRIEFYQHNIDIPNKDVGKVAPRSTKFYKYLIAPFKKGQLVELPTTSDDEFQVTKIQNLMHYEFDNISIGAYGRTYGEVISQMSEDLKEEGSLSLPAPIVLKFINFGETRRSSEASYFLLTGNRRINLALHYGIPVKVWVVDLIPSRRDVREFVEKSGIMSKGPVEFKEFLKNKTGKESIEELTARDRFKVIQALKEV